MKARRQRSLSLRGLLRVRSASFESFESKGTFEISGSAMGSETLPYAFSIDGSSR